MLKMHKLLDKLSIQLQLLPICKYLIPKTILSLENIKKQHQKKKMIKQNKMQMIIITNQMMEMEEVHKSFLNHINLNRRNNKRVKKTKRRRLNTILQINIQILPVNFKLDVTIQQFISLRLLLRKRKRNIKQIFQNSLRLQIKLELQFLSNLNQLK